MDDAETFDDIFARIAKANRRKLPILKKGPTECAGCGSCCEFFQAIDVFEEETNFQWLKANGYITEDNEHTMYAMKQVEDSTRCIALRGEVGKDASCSIYENRPEVCRIFTGGSDRCRSILKLENYDCFVNCQT